MGASFCCPACISVDELTSLPFLPLFPVLFSFLEFLIIFHFAVANAAILKTKHIQHAVLYGHYC